MADETEEQISGQPDVPDLPPADQPPGSLANGSLAVEEQLPVASDGALHTDSNVALPFPIVGIGASAGGIEALLELFRQLPVNTGMAFVVISHLSPDQKSYLPDIVGRETSMPAEAIRSGTGPQPDRIYFLPPNSRVRLERGMFQLESREEGVPRPIDYFFVSLAAAQHSRAVGVVLSGMNADGAVGLKTIKGEGGIALVQSPESARFPDMPRNSISADHVDFVLPPEQIALQLTQLGDQFRQIGTTRLVDERGIVTAPPEQAFAKIVRLLRSVSGVDFRLYKPSTLQRRIARRMLILRINSLPGYAAYLLTNPKELENLQEDALIGVTRFFRDPEAFEFIKRELLPRILLNRPTDQEVRILVAGCSSGEEVYSLAICLLEHLSGSSFEPPIRIFGTDASGANVEKARAAIYPDSIVTEVSSERLRRFFVHHEQGFQVAKRVRDLCVFARQNLCVDPPFSRLDLVSCRNVLIYFGSELQRRLIRTFHYALRPGGFLLLGTSETIREFVDLFALLDRKTKVYERVGAGPGELIGAVPRVAAYEAAPVIVDPGANPETHLLGKPWGDVELQRLTDRIVLARYAPPGVVVNEQLEILQFRGHTGPFLEMPPGSSTLNLLRLANESIAPHLSAALKRAIDDDVPVQAHQVEVQSDNARRYLSIEVLPIHSSLARPRSFLVLFVDASRAAGFSPAAHVVGHAAEEQVPSSLTQTQRDLSATRHYLKSLIAERDANNQELVSANEEIQSANEELQSTNEELETTKEELQSANEELQTVNDELQTRNSALVQTSNDLINLLNGVNLPVLMLSSDHLIRHFTPQTQRLMKLRPSDVGRPFSDIRLNLEVEDLTPLFDEVLETLAPRELEVRDEEGHWYLLRMRPYRTTENRIDGLVLVLVDIDQLRRAQQELQDARDFAASVMQCIPLPVVVIDGRLLIRSTNAAFAELAGMRPDLLQGRFLPHLASALWAMGEPLGRLLEQLRDKPQESGMFECDYKTPGEAKPRTLLVRGRCLQPDGERFTLITFEDITAHKEIEHLLESDRLRLTGEVETTTLKLGRSQQELRALAANLLDTQESESRRLARELHDDVSQRLAAVKMDADIISGQHDLAAARLCEKLADIGRRVGAISEDLRRVSHRLHPSTLEHLGLTSSLRALTEDFGRREGMIMDFSELDVPADVSLEVATVFYRIAQESLRNIAKHAGKTHVKVSLRGRPNALELQVSDAGLGFDPDDSRSGLGLVSMEERARLIGGRVSVESALGEGTKVTLTAPLASQ